MWYDVDASFSMLWLASLQKLRVAWCAGAVPHELPAVLEGSMYGNPTPCSPCIMSMIIITQRSARLQGPHAALRHSHGIACTLSHERMEHAANDMSHEWYMQTWLFSPGGFGRPICPDRPPPPTFRQSSSACSARTRCGLPHTWASWSAATRSRMVRSQPL